MVMNLSLFFFVCLLVCTTCVHVGAGFFFLLVHTYKESGMATQWQQMQPAFEVRFFINVLQTIIALMEAVMVQWR